MKLRLLVILMVLALLGAAAYSFFRKEEYPLISPHIGDVVQAVYATGEVEPLYWAKIAPQIAGKIQAVLVDDGQVVKKDDVLAELENSVESAQRQELESRKRFLAGEVQRQAKLQKSDFASRQRYELALSEYREVSARLEAQAHLINRMYIRSPIDGIVLRRDVEPGETVGTTDTIMWVGQPEPLRITAEVDEEDIPLVAVGQKVLIKADAFPGQALEGNVADITPKGDPVNKNFRVRISLPEHSPLLVGMTVDVNILTRQVQGALLVPISSLEGDTAYVRKERGAIEARKVKIGVRDEESVEILEGLTAEDRLLANPAAYLAQSAQGG